MLTPTRYLWSHAREYQEELPKYLRPIMKWMQKNLRAWDRTAAQRPDYLVPISQLVAKRIQKYYHRTPTEPIYPPVETKPLAKEPRSLLARPEAFFFTWGRHVRYKSFEMILRAAARSKTPVVVAGTGPDSRRLRQLARRLDPHQNLIFFVGNVDDAELAWFLEHATGTVFPQVEDFGIVIMESLLAECPSIVHHMSGAAELMGSQDGIKLSEVNTKTVAQAMVEMQETAWERLDIRRRARQYAGVRFSQEWDRFVREAWKKHVQALHDKE